MLKSILSSFILIVGFANSISSQQVRPLPNPIINIHCGQLSLLRHTGLVPPPTSQQIPVTCTYRIHIISFAICQMRLEFREFSLPAPTYDSSVPGISYQKCSDGYLQVGNITLCGENRGQHVYIPVTPRQGQRQLEITINTRNGNGFTRPNWNIAVHQFECPFGQSRSLNVVEPTSTADNTGIVRSPRTFYNDWLAPAGCLQYHVQRTGQIETFNFNNGAGPYLGDMHYAICFRRQRGDQSLKLIPTIFRLDNGNPSGLGFNDDCQDQLRTEGRSEDYLYIPDAETNEIPSTRARLFCGQSIVSKIITSSPLGSFLIAFNSDKQYSNGTETGFRMQYEIV